MWSYNHERPNMSLGGFTPKTPVGHVGVAFLPLAIAKTGGITPATYRTSMKRDWNVIREVLIEVEALSKAAGEDRYYEAVIHGDEAAKSEMALLLWEAGFINGIDASSADADAVIATGLSWDGHDLLATLRSSDLWERIKQTAKAKGLELTFDAVKALGQVVLAAIVRE